MARMADIIKASPDHRTHSVKEMVAIVRVELEISERDAIAARERAIKISKPSLGAIRARPRNRSTHNRGAAINRIVYSYGGRIGTVASTDAMS